MRRRWALLLPSCQPVTATGRVVGHGDPYAFVDSSPQNVGSSSPHCTAVQVHRVHRACACMRACAVPAPTVAHTVTAHPEARTHGDQRRRPMCIHIHGGGGTLDGGREGGPTDTTGVGCEESYAYPHRLSPRTHVGQVPTFSSRPHWLQALRSLTGPIPCPFRVPKSTRGPPSPSPQPVPCGVLDPRSRPSGARFRATKPHQHTSQSVV